MPDVEEPPKDHVSPTDAVSDALHKFAELRAYAQQHIAARIDLAKLTARKIAILVVLGIVALFACAATLIIALVLLLSGIAGAIGAGIGGRAWAGNLIVGAVVLGLFAGGGFFGIRVLKKSSMKSTVKKYETAQKQQRDSFGRSSRDRTAAAGNVKI
jgi:hypothetical protein